MEEKKEEIQPLTEESIKTNALSVYDHVELCVVFGNGARWAKERSDEYWKSKVIEEAEKAFMAGVLHERDQYKRSNTHDGYTAYDDISEYMNKLKERLNVK